MAKLTTLKPVLRPLPHRLGRMEAGEVARNRERDGTQEYRRWYKTARWQKLRWQVLVRDSFTCYLCGRPEGDTSLLVADHIKAHKGDAALFWDEANLACTCKLCHDSTKQRMERSGQRQGDGR